MGEEIKKYPIHDKIFNHIRSCNGTKMYYWELCKQIEDVKLNKSEIQKLLVDAFSKLGLTDRQIGILVGKAGLISVSLRFNRGDTRKLIRDMEKLGYWDVNNKVVVIK